jgi:propionyl-CoA carboxylase beta chain
MSAATVDENAPDRRTTAGKAADLEARRAEALGRRTKAVDKQHAKGKQTAMERIVELLDEDSFSSSTAWPGTARTPSGSRRTARTATVSSPATAPSTAARSASSAQDVTVFGGSLGEVYGEKIVKVMEHGHQNRLPR